VNTTYGYDPVSRLLSILHKLGSTTLDGASYTYDNAGNRTSKTDLQANVTSNYGYDNIYQLLQVTQGASTTESYSYDAVGNRLSSSSVSPYSYNSSNELISTPSLTYTYDYNGNTQSKSDGTAYTWDYDNRLKQVTLPGSGGTVNFKYDPFGRRAQKSFAQNSTTTTVNYLYDGPNLLEEVDQSGNVLARYSGLDEQLANLRSSTTSYYEADGLGMITSLSDSAGALANTYRYDSYGNLLASTGTITNSFQYAGREFDSETGLYYNRARYYSPQLGRFVSEDPLGFDGGINLYAYVGNSPSNLIDPFGLRPGDKYPTLTCAGWHAIWDFNTPSRHRNLEYQGKVYRNADGTFSYTDPNANGGTGIGTPTGGRSWGPITTPAGTTVAGWYHTHAAFDPSMNDPHNPLPGNPGYRWHLDGNEIFSNTDMSISDSHFGPGFLGTPRGTTEEYTPRPGHPLGGTVRVLSRGQCGCN
jgi:RHS repeat-associated protein